MILTIALDSRVPVDLFCYPSRSSMCRPPLSAQKLGAISPDTVSQCEDTRKMEEGSSAIPETVNWAISTSHALTEAIYQSCIFFISLHNSHHRTTTNTGMIDWRNCSVTSRHKEDGYGHPRGRHLHKLYPVGAKLIWSLRNSVLSK
ncbi:hypothetical protein PM082_017651 [Marasmius tenuissimus]|nr:hypothetical protein PM082_017651 [Marasmius tenuissimus]